MALIEQRHPAFRNLIRLWRAHSCDGELPRASTLGPDELADLAGQTVMLTLDATGEHLVIVESGSAVDAIYGAAMRGCPAAGLSPERHDAEREARAAIATGRPLLVEDELADGNRRRRIARLYLPLSKDDGSPDGVLCGVVAIA